MPSSSTSRSQRNSFNENDDNGTGRLITQLIEEDIRNADAEKAQDHDRWMRIARVRTAGTHG